VLPGQLDRGDLLAMSEDVSCDCAARTAGIEPTDAARRSLLLALQVPLAPRAGTAGSLGDLETAKRRCEL
jgi:hypothetical protein